MLVLLNEFSQSKYTYGTFHNKTQNITCTTEDHMGFPPSHEHSSSSKETTIVTSNTED